MIWLWDKEKTFKVVPIAVSNPITRLRCGPCSSLMLTTSGQGVLKSWYFGADGATKSTHLLPSSKEAENFLDHVWLPSTGAVLHKMVALADVTETAAAPQLPFGSASEHPLSSSSSSNNLLAPVRRQNLFVFEGIDTANPGSAVSAPVSLELRQTISVRVPTNSDPTHSAPPQGFEVPKIEAVVPTSKGFCLVGGLGFVAVYERTQDRREAYWEVRRLSVGDLTLLAGALMPSEEKLFVVAKNGRILTLSLAIEAPAAKDGDPPEEKALPPRPGQRSTAEQQSAARSQGAADLLYGGHHTLSLACASMARDRPLVATVSSDHTARVWNYESLKCELVHNFQSDEPLAVGMHPSGFQMLVSFKDRIRLYNLLIDKLRPYKETVCKNCKELQFSHGGHLFAGASSINVVVYETSSLQQLALFQGHMMAIRRLEWALGDEVVFSAGTDGNVYGWPVSREARIDVVSANNRASAILGLAIDCPNLLFPKLRTGPSEGSDDRPADGGSFAKAPSCYSAVISLIDGTIKAPPWALDGATDAKPGLGRQAAGRSIVPEDPQIRVTALHLSADKRLLFAGTSNGFVRLYVWPLVGDAVEGLYQELQAHESAVIFIRESPTGSGVVSVSEEGSVFVHSVARDPLRGGGVSNKAGDRLLTGEQQTDFSMETAFNSDVVLISIEDMEEHVHEVVELKKALHDNQVKSEFLQHQQEVDHGEEKKKICDGQEQQLKEEKQRYDALRAEYDRRSRELLSTIEAKEVDHVKVTSELENRYEHKLADQMERYDLLAEDMELLKQRCEGALQFEREEFARQLGEQKNETRAREKRLKTENRRLGDERAADESAFKEILDQQEMEYEDELKQLISSAEGELASERDVILKLRTLVQTKNTKLDQLKKKVLEISGASKARLSQLEQERKEKQKLQETIDHCKRNLMEHEQALSEKEKTILDLRNTTRTLENFRFVLDFRLQQLSAERGPITSHIEGLERHIATMYEELVEEFDLKKSAVNQAEQREQKVALLSAELKQSRSDCKRLEQYISCFKRELGNVAGNMVVGKGLEEAVRVLYKKHVRGEKVSDSPLKANSAVRSRVRELVRGENGDSSASSEEEESAEESAVHKKPRSGLGKGSARIAQSKSQAREIEESLVDTAKEAERQKRFVERESANLKHRLDSQRAEVTRIARTKFIENSNLLYECNDLRRTVRDLERKLSITGCELAEAKRTIVQMRSLVVSAYNGSLHGTGDPSSNQAEAAGPDGCPSPLQSETLDSLPQHSPQQREQWVVHNSLCRSGSSLPLGGRLPSPPKTLPQGLESRPVDPALAMTRLRQAASLSSLQPASEASAALKPLARTYVNNYKGLAVHEKKQHLVAERLGREVEQLAEQLDEGQRERVMQRREIARLKRLCSEQAAQGAAGGLRGESKAGSKRSSAGPSGNVFEESSGLEGEGRRGTTADRTGKPSKEDLLGMTLTPLEPVPDRSVRTNPSSRSQSRYV